MRVYPPPTEVSHFEILVGLACSNDPDKYAHGSIAIGMVSQARQVTGDGPDKRDNLVLQVWGWVES